MIYLTSSVITCRCRKWVINTRRIEELLPKTSEQLYKNYKLCAKHFEDSQFMNADQKKSLVHNAVPTLFDIPNPPPKVTIQRKLPIRCNEEESKTKKQKGTYNGIF